MVRMRAFQARDRGSIPRHRSSPCGQMDKAPPSGGGDCAFESRQGCSGAGLEVMTSALHAEGPEFDPRAPYVFCIAVSESYHVCVTLNMLT